MILMKRFLSHPVMGLYAAMLLGVAVLSIGVGLTVGHDKGLLISALGTVLVLFGFAAYAAVDATRRSR